MTRAVIMEITSRKGGLRMDHGAQDSGAGSALLAALITLIALTAVASAVWYSARLDLLIGTRHREAVEAFYLAESGWNRVLADARIGGLPSSELLRSPQGSVRVEVTPLLVVSPDSVVFALHSTGYRTGSTGAVEARRSVRVLAIEAAADGIRRWHGTWREVW